MISADFVTVARVSDIVADRGLRVNVLGRDLALFLHHGEWFAMDDACPHKRTPLSKGNCAMGQVTCPLHGWTFNLRTGACAETPHKPVTTHEVRTVGEEIQIRLNSN